MKTVTIIIGNSDDKLSQKQWSIFAGSMRTAVTRLAERVQFYGLSLGDEKWQNAAWTIQIYENAAYHLRQEIRELAEHFNQDAVAWIEGTPELLGPTDHTPPPDAAQLDTEAYQA